ncbi:hypothetical protein [Bdellovibrio sp. HCB209]|uniref:hypothetical protein n=1 Tax=Bdellovibrio sp. HCB209 TaxID=3394354 RepID=UPI0039B57655
MKTLLIVMTMIISTTALAANKDKSCNAYFKAATSNAKPQVRIELGLKAMAIAAELTLTPAQESKILANSLNFISQNPSKQDDFEKMFQFACTNDLDADEVEQLAAQLEQLESMN